jgi:Flp pilus assembly protein TadG
MKVASRPERPDEAGVVSRGRVLEQAPHRHGERGQALLEFTLILPVFLFVLFAIVDFGRAYSCNVTITNAAREGARMGITGATSAQIIARTQSAASSYNDAHLTVTVTNAQGTSGTDVTVTAQYQLSFITPIAAFARLLPGAGSIGSGAALSSSAVMRIE